MLWRLTPEQEAIVSHDGHAFIEACPGAGKTRTIVARAHRLLSASPRKGLAFLSFTTAAAGELEVRLRHAVGSPDSLFPSFIGTFDRFLWQFLVAPFGVDGCNASPRIVPEKPDWDVRPYERAPAVKLRCFDRRTGAFIADAMKREYVPAPIDRWEAAARKTIARALSAGMLDFEDVRNCVGKRLADTAFAQRVGAALACRFGEIIVDEAQDCNVFDLSVLSWLRASGVCMKIVCDPNQSIYGFRGSSVRELLAYRERFDASDRLALSGNFRSTPAICAAVSQLRPPGARGQADTPLGRHKGERTPVYILAYPGSEVPNVIGDRFQRLLGACGLLSGESPILAATRSSAMKAAGRTSVDAGEHRTLLLAQAVVRFHCACDAVERREALSQLHCVVLRVRGNIDGASEYSRYLMSDPSGDGRWRSEVISIAQALQVQDTEDSKNWLRRARGILNSRLVGPSTIGQRLSASNKLDSMLRGVGAGAPSARTIHEVKGKEFTAVCVVLTQNSSGDILSVLSGEESSERKLEEARKIYVAASRAERLLVLAVPVSRQAGFLSVLERGGGAVQVVPL